MNKTTVRMQCSDELNNSLDAINPLIKQRDPWQQWRASLELIYISVTLTI